MKFKLIVLIGVFIASTGFNGTETERMVTGAVTDGRVPLPGVSVYVKGTSLGTITDKKGHYSIEVKDDKAVLVFSFIGFETRERSEEHTSELQSLMRISYAVFCLKKKKINQI